MLVLIHVFAAISSLIVAGLTYLSPSASRLKVNLALTSLTVASGTALVIREPAHILSTCLSGLLYLGFIALAILASRSKLLSSK